jgi:hypothetical protein
MNGQVDLVVKQRVLQFLDKQSDSTRLMKRHAAISVSTGSHFDDLKSNVGVVGLQKLYKPARLPER